MPRRCRAVVVALLATAIAALLVPVVTPGPPAGAAPQPDAWCGTDESPTDRPDAVAGPQVHVIYAYPSDGDDDFTRWVTPIVRDLAVIDSWWQSQDPTRTLRFDLANFPGCGTAFGAVDVSSVRLPFPSSIYAGDEPDVINRLARDLRGAFTSRAKKYLVYYDGAVASGAVCGRGASGASPGASAVVYLRSEAPCVRSGGGVGARGGGLAAFITAHELIHTLDELVTPGPHACPDGEGHYCGDPSDVMAPSASAGSRLATAALDPGRDDYYGTGAPGDVRDSVFLAHLDATQSRLVVSVGEPGGGPGGTVTSDLPGVTCPGVCDLTWETGTRVVLQAVADIGLAFAGWTGACSGTAPSCVVVIDADRAVGARFGAPGSIAVRVSGRGSVDGCARRCARGIVTGQDVVLRATARRGSRFLRWGGACRGRSPTCTLVAVPGDTVRAVFASG